MIRAIRAYKKDWGKKSIALRNWQALGNTIEEIHLKYFLCFFNDATNEPDPIGWIVDYALIYDHGIFEFKLPKLLIGLWESSREAIISCNNDLIHYEKKVLSKGELDIRQLHHVVYIKNVLDFIISKKTGIDMKERRKIIAGDYKPITHFQR